MIRNGNRWLIVSVLVILAAGIALVIWTAHHEDLLLREDLLTKSRFVKNGISIGEVESLTGTDADLASPAYIALKGDLQKIRAVSPVIRFIYLMGRHPDGTIFFLVDSEPPGSADYSPPGEAYHEASALLQDTFITGNGATEGPQVDRWGTWVSGLVPIRDEASGSIVAVLGMDIDARDWNLQIMNACGPAIVGTLLLILLVLIFFYMLTRNERERAILEESESTIRKSEEMFRTVFERGPLGMAIADEGFRFVRANPTFCKMVGYSQDELQSMTFPEITHPDHREVDIAQTRRLAAGELSEYVTDKQYIKKSGEILLASVVVSAIRDSGGRFLYYLALITDISERRFIEAEMNYHTEQVQQYASEIAKVNSKLNLLNSVTRHDILNQLTAVLGYLEMMKTKFPDPALQEIIAKEVQAANTIQKQIMFTKDYQDIGVRSPQWFDVREMIESEAATLPLSGIAFSVRCDGIEILADPMLGKVFYTLMENTLRHGKTVTAIDFSCSTQDDSLRIVYQDNGAGIPAEYKEAIFERRFFTHTGFGLFLSRTILDITGITIREDGEPGKGARFEITVHPGAFRFTASDDPNV